MGKINILILNKFREVGGNEIFILEILRHLNRDRYNPIIAPIGETSDAAHDLLNKAKVKIYDDLFRSSASEINPHSKNNIIKNVLSRVISPQGRRSPFDPGAIFRLADILKKERIHILFYADKHSSLNLICRRKKRRE